MSKSQDDMRKSHEYDDVRDFRRDIFDRNSHRKEKKIRNALHTRNIEALMEEDDLDW